MKVFCTLARDSMPRIAQNMYRVMKELMEPEDALIVVENDSRDFTRQFLEDFNHLYPIDILNGPRFLPKFRSVVSLKRAKQMALLRNLYLDRVQNFYIDATHMVVFDSDLALIPRENFQQMITNEAVVSSNGLHVSRFRSQDGQIHERKIYYDSWAYEHLTDDTRYVTETHYEAQPAFPEQQDLLEVRSGFGGLAVYLVDDRLRESKYRPYRDGELCEHAGLHEQLREKGGKVWIQTNYQPIV